MADLIDRQTVLDAIDKYILGKPLDDTVEVRKLLKLITKIYRMPSVRQQYVPVTAEDFAKTMSESSLYGFMAWHGEALALMKRMGFVICKKT